MKHVIRPYTNSDLSAIKECIVELQEFERILDPQRLEGLKVAHDYLSHLLSLCDEDRGHIFVAEANNSIVGMVSIYIEEDKKHFRKMIRFAHIADLIVIPEYKDAGIVKGLLEQAEAYAKSRNVSHIQASVLKGHDEGLTGYLRNGYRELEVIVRKKVSE